MVASAFVVVMPIALAMQLVLVAQPVSGLAIEIPITPPVLVKVPTAVILPPLGVEAAAIPSPAVIRMPLTPKFVAPVKLTLPNALTITPPMLPVFCTKAPKVIPPVAPNP